MSFSAIIDSAQPVLFHPFPTCLLHVLFCHHRQCSISHIVFLSNLPLTCLLLPSSTVLNQPYCIPFQPASYMSSSAIIDSAQSALLCSFTTCLLHVLFCHHRQCSISLIVFLSNLPLTCPFLPSLTVLNQPYCVPLQPASYMSFSAIIDSAQSALLYSFPTCLLHVLFCHHRQCSISLIVFLSNLPPTCPLLPSSTVLNQPYCVPLQPASYMSSSAIIDSAQSALLCSFTTCLLHVLFCHHRQCSISLIVFLSNLPLTCPFLPSSTVLNQPYCVPLQPASYMSSSAIIDSAQSALFHPFPTCLLHVLFCHHRQCSISLISSLSNLPPTCPLLPSLTVLNQPYCIPFQPASYMSFSAIIDSAQSALLCSFPTCLLHVLFCHHRQCSIILISFLSNLPLTCPFLPSSTVLNQPYFIPFQPTSYMSFSAIIDSAQSAILCSLPTCLLHVLLCHH